MCIVINLFGGPGTGKSTLAARVFSELKVRLLSCELITEYAKDKVWEQSLHVLNDQIYVFGKQQHRQFVVKDKVDIIITDAPILLSLYYSSLTSKLFKDFVIYTYNSYENVNYLLRRNKELPYDQTGRNQTLKNSQLADVGIEKILKDNNLPFSELYIKTDISINTDVIVKHICNRLKMVRRIYEAI